MKMSECTHECSTCGSASTCKSQGGIPKELPKKGSVIKNVIAVISGKGGVGKSLTTALLAVASNRNGYKTALFPPSAFSISEGKISLSTIMKWVTSPVTHTLA